VLQTVNTRDYISDILNPGILAVFTNPESWNWHRINPGFLHDKNLLKFYLFKCLMIHKSLAI